MNEAVIRMWIQNALSRAGAWYYHAPDVPQAELRARLDIIALSTGGAAVIEVKDVKAHLYSRGEKAGTIDGVLRFAEIEDNKRHLMDCMDACEIPVFIAFSLAGLRIPNREVLVIPWSEYYWWEMAIDPARKSFYWSTILAEFSRFALTKDERGYCIGSEHPLGVALQSGSPLAIPFSFELVENLSRRFENADK